MKKIIVLLILLPQIFYGQWVQLSYQPTGFINDMTCVSEDIVFAAGKVGYLIKTSDGGATWSTKTTGTTLDLVKIRFANANIGYAMLQNKTLIKTTDGGNTWTAPFGNNIYDFSVVNATVFYITTFDGVLLKTIDSGLTFITVNTTTIIGSIQFINENVGFCGANLMNRSNDGGLTWTAIGSCDKLPADYGFYHYLFHFVNENIGFKIDGNNVFKTIDGGANYTFLSTVNHHVGKVIGASENVVWLITVDFLLNGQPNYTTRIETIGVDVNRVDNFFPIFLSTAFASPTVGYGIYPSGILFKNSTGTMLSTTSTNINNKTLIFTDSSTQQIKLQLPENLIAVPTKITVFDGLGKIILTQTFQNQQNIVLDSQMLTKGLFLITVATNNNYQTQKIIIN